MLCGVLMSLTSTIPFMMEQIFHSVERSNFPLLGDLYPGSTTAPRLLLPFTPRVCLLYSCLRWKGPAASSTFQVPDLIPALPRLKWSMAFYPQGVGRNAHETT